MLKASASRGPVSLAQEVAILEDLRHPNTSLFMGASLDGPQPFILTECVRLLCPFVK